MAEEFNNEELEFTPEVVQQEEAPIVAEEVVEAPVEEAPKEEVSVEETKEEEKTEA
jgi:hypothetical protein